MTADHANIRFRGPASLVGALAQMLEEQGLTVQYEPPFERKALGVDIAALVLAVTGHPDIRRAMAAGIAKFKERFPDGGDAQIED
jgi:hypothetical protein